MVAPGFADLTSWHKTLHVKPTLAAIRHHADTLAAGEVERALNKKQLAGLDDAQREAVRATVRAVVNKLLHPSMAALRDSAEAGNGTELAAAARLLFGITSEDDAP